MVSLKISLSFDIRPDPNLETILLKINKTNCLFKVSFPAAFPPA